MSRIKDLRMKLTEDDIKFILGKLNIFPVAENAKAIIYPTYCHNAEGGGAKLYYYKNEKIFKCYTQCSRQFDIFELIIKIKKFRDEEILLKDAIDFTGIEQENIYSQEVYEGLEYLKKLSSKGSLETLFGQQDQTTKLDINILDRYSYNKNGVATWLNEGISEQALKKFRIGYDMIQNAIVIPNFNHNGDLVGVRGRFLNPDAPAKYMPMKYGNQYLSHPTGKIFYGYYENKENIKKLKMAIIFEGEKSVLKMEDLYPENNIALATTGKKISIDHLNSLIELNIKEVVLAYDKDYSKSSEIKQKFEEYNATFQLLKPYFNTSIIMDYENKLKLKDSPIDRGKDIFEYLLKIREKR